MFFFYLCHIVLNKVRHIIERINAHYPVALGWTIVLLTLWQLVVALFGVDLCDTGYYLTFFDNVFSSPGAVEYNFMYYLSGMAGGALSTILPEGGRWLALRLAGVLCNTAVMVMLAWALRRALPATAVILGCLMVVASLVQFPYTFNNDLMSVLLWVAALVCIYKGLTGRRTALLLLAGIIVGANTFTRIPNVLAAGLTIMPLIAHYYYYGSWRSCWRQAGMMLLGMAAGALAVIGLMMALGHWELFVQNMADLLGVATGSSGEASHNAGGLVTAMLVFYRQCLLVGAKMLALAGLLWLVDRYLRHPLLRYGAWALVAVITVWFMWHQSHIMHPLWVMCVAGLAWVICQKRSHALAAWLGLYLLLVFPLGSDGATNNGGIIAWMAAPVAALAWQRRRYVILPLAFIAVGLVQTVTVGAYFDGGPLWLKTATIDDGRAALVHTTPERARIINESLAGLEQHVKKGDTLLCYGSIPMMNHLTRTVPAIGCSWPELLSAQALDARLDAQGDSRPAILRQKFNDLGPYWSEATDDYLHAYPHVDGKFLDQDKMDAINRYINNHGYHIAWQNQWFVLYLAD